MKIYHLLFSAFGPQNWWPADTELEMIVGAILTQNTNWKNVEKAIRNLKTNGLLSIEALSRISLPDLAQHIRPAGYYNLKARRLKNLIALIDTVFGGEVAGLFTLDTERIRHHLLSVKGVGLETADSIILYAGERPIFVVDVYTHRLITRHRLLDAEAGYYDLQTLFMENLPPDVQLFKEFHALIVRTGKNYCRTNPLCTQCPLEGLIRDNNA